MERQPDLRPPRWRKIPKDQFYKVEALLRARERLCVAASARFLRIRENGGHVWYLSENSGEISALLLHSNRSLFPVFCDNPDVPGPRFLNRFLGKVHIHAIQGLRDDTQLLEQLMERQGYYAAERIDYDLMSTDSRPGSKAFGAGPPGLVIRKPMEGDVENLIALQSAYEQEEVVPKNGVFDPDVSRLNLKHILSTEHVLLAELNGRIVGKINTSAESFTRHQIGGVYVRPECRGLGIALKMTAVFVEGILAGGKGINLFVKKRNAAARAVYLKAGFSVLADYRICYY